KVDGVGVVIEVEGIGPGEIGQIVVHLNHRDGAAVRLQKGSYAGENVVEPDGGVAEESFGSVARYRERRDRDIDRIDRLAVGPERLHQWVVQNPGRETEVGELDVDTRAGAQGNGQAALPAQAQEGRQVPIGLFFAPIGRTWVRHMYRPRHMGVHTLETNL